MPSARFRRHLTAEAPNAKPPEIGPIKEMSEDPQSGFLTIGAEAYYMQDMPEMLLAAKLSALLRGLKWLEWSGGILLPLYTYEPKDLFDTHLMLKEPKALEADLLEKYLLNV